MSKAEELLRDPKSVLVFDVDGVLAVLEFGEYNHFIYDDEEWDRATRAGANFFTEDKVIKRMQRFLETKDKNNIYVITTVGNNNEGEYKREYVNKYYGILKENVYYVDHNRNKLEKLLEIRKQHPDVDDHHIIMIEDSVDILTDIMEKTNFTTVHISSFFDI